MLAVDVIYFTSASVNNGNTRTMRKMVARVQQQIVLHDDKTDFSQQVLGGTQPFFLWDGGTQNDKKGLFLASFGSNTTILFMEYTL